MAAAAVARDGDSGSHGGTISAIILKTQVNGLLALTEGAIYNCPIHGPNPMLNSGRKRIIEGKVVVCLGDSATCGGVVTSASSNVFAG